jgi:asparagine synthase (glutamine-hydrolysing)
MFNAEEAFANIETIIYHLETYEPELIRSAIPNFFLAKMTS